MAAIFQVLIVLSAIINVLSVLVHQLIVWLAILDSIWLEALALFVQAIVFLAIAPLSVSPATLDIILTQLIIVALLVIAIIHTAYFAMKLHVFLVSVDTLSVLGHV